MQNPDVWALALLSAVLCDREARPVPSLQFLVSLLGSLQVWAVERGSRGNLGKESTRSSLMLSPQPLSKTFSHLEKDGVGARLSERK